MATEEQQTKMEESREAYGNALNPNLVDFTDPASFRKLAQDMFALYVQAERAVLTSQSYQIAGQSLTRADLEKIRKGRQEWQEILNSVIGGGRRTFRSITPVAN